MSQVCFSCSSHHPQEFFCLEGRNPFYLGKKAELGKFRIPEVFSTPGGKTKVDEDVGQGEVILLGQLQNKTCTAVILARLAEVWYILLLLIRKPLLGDLETRVQLVQLGLGCFNGSVKLEPAQGLKLLFYLEQAFCAAKG